MLKSLVKSIILFSLGVSVISCGQQQETIHTGDVDLETAKIISHLPAMVVEPDAELKIRFVQDQVTGPVLATADLDQDAVVFEPDLPGRLSWSDNRTLTFSPSTDLKTHQFYQGILYLDRILPQKFENAKPVKFSFRVAGQELTDFEGDFELVEPNDPVQVRYKGRLDFSQKFNIDKLKDAIELSSESGKAEVEIEPVGIKQMKLVTDVIRRNEKDIKFKLTIDAQAMGLPADFKHEFVLPALKNLQVTNIRKDESGSQPRVRIQLSDDLDENQDINGFVSVSPEMKFSLKKMGKSILVNAPFEYGKTYNFQVRKGLRSRWATELKQDFKETITFEDLLPEIKFDRDGVFLTSSNQRKISFLTVNVKRVRLNVMRVFESNIGQFLQTTNLDGQTERRDRFGYNINRVGVTVADTTLEIGAVSNRWLQSELDLTTVLKPLQKGLLLLSLRFEKEDMIYSDNADQEYANYRNNRRNRYGTPGSYWYMYNKAQVFKPIILSDIGLTYKKLDNSAVVFATNLLDAAPLEKVKVRLRSYQNQIIAEQVTNSSGMASFNQMDESVFYIEGEFNNQRSVIKANEMAWNLSAFEIDGRSQQKGGLSGFTFTDRGVYRPGDTVNVSLIVRDKKNSFPDNHPVSLEVFNPLGQLHTRMTQNKAKDGFYSFKFNTQSQDPTGNYRAEFKAGSGRFSELIRVETIVPERIKIDVSIDPDVLMPGKRDVDLNIQANYLFGNPAARLETTIDVNVRSMAMRFPKYEEYIFESENITFQPVDQQIIRKDLSNDGQLYAQWRAPDFSQAPARLRAHFEVKVFEKGGRFSKQDKWMPIEPFENYVGIKRPDIEWGYARIGQDYNIPAVLLDTKGNPVAGRTLKYRIYRNETHWWWEYSSRDQYRMRYKSDSNTEKIGEGLLVSAARPVFFNFKPEDSGEYLVEVIDDRPGGHSASYFISAYYWGQGPAAQKDAGNLLLKTDKEKYLAGDEAKITFPVPEKGNVLVSVEKGARLLNSAWYSLPVPNNEMNISVPVTREMLPNAYVSVSVLQPHAETKNDRPIRTYGVVPLNVIDQNSELGIRITMPDQLEPGKPFSVNLQTADNSRAQFTIAVVDEGLLQLTRFKTPNPWHYFYSKERLGVQTYDLFGHVIGANRGDIFRTFSIGGGLDEMAIMAEKQEEDKTAKRFKAVAMFEGPIATDSKGKATVRFTMPEYIGAVRVMVVAADNGRYGASQKNVPVKTDLMVLPTLPRVLGPEDQIDIPVTVFALKDNLGPATISLEVNGPLKIVGDSEKEITFAKQEEKDILFKAQADAGIGLAEIKIVAKAESVQSKYTTELQVRSSAGEEFISIEKTIIPGNEVTFKIPDDGIKGSNKAVLSVRRFKNLNINRRLYHLIQFPYGCIEQTVSSAFPQLYLERFIPPSSLAKQDMDDNINKAIKHLRKFKLPSGAMSYWPGNRDASEWGTIYAGHFLVEAGKKGYHVPDDMLADWVRYQQSQARMASGNLMIRVYRLYVLALTGNAAMGPMNLIRESSFPALNNTQRWLLAAAYQLAGVTVEANMILKETGVEVKSYREFGGTYGSQNRDKSIILDQLLLFKKYNNAAAIADELALLLKSNTWLSTQESAFILMALGKYMQQTAGEADTEISGSILHANGRKISFNTKDIFDLSLDQFGKDVTVKLDENNDVKQAYAILDWQGLPLKSIQPDFEKGLELQLQWLDENGQVINPGLLKQGQSIWGRFSVRVKDDRTRVEELALTQILPAGWEIENLRLNQNDLPSWTRSYKFKQAEYEDIRDDRISWFFDLSGYEKQKDFLLKINAVTVGEFFMPGAVFTAMYDNDYRATKAGRSVKVLGR